jgi:hypothetical protein
MQNLPRKSIVMLHKSCRFFHKESNKIGFASFWFLYSFLCIFQDSAKHIHYFRSGFSIRPLEVFRTLWIGPFFALRPLERTWGSQLGLQAPAGGGPAKFRRTGDRDQWGAGGGRPVSHLGSISGLAWGSGAAGEGARRLSRVAASWSSTPARLQRWQGN